MFYSLHKKQKPNLFSKTRSGASGQKGKQHNELYKKGSGILDNPACLSHDVFKAVIMATGDFPVFAAATWLLPVRLLRWAEVMRVPLAVGLGLWGEGFGQGGRRRGRLLPC